MESRPLPPTLEITDPKAAAFLTDAETTLYIKPFMDPSPTFAGVTIAEAAEQLGVAPGSLYHRVAKMVRLGLLEVVRTLPRRGRPLKVYRATARHFFVPFSATSAESLEAFVSRTDAQWYPHLLKGLVGAWTACAGDVPTWGLNIGKSENGLLTFSFNRSPDLSVDAALHHASGVVYVWDTSFRLSREDVQALREELEDVLERYRERRSGPRQVLRLALAPWNA